MFKTTLKSLSVLGIVAGFGAGQAMAGSLYLDEGSFLGAAGTLDFESFESATGSGSSIDVGPFVVNDTSLSIKSGTNATTHHATDGSQYLYHGGGGALTLTFDSAIDAIGFYLTDVFWTAVGPEVVVTTNTGEIINTGLTNKTSEAYVGILADSLFTSLTIGLQAGDGVGLDSVSYGIANSGEQVVIDNPQVPGSPSGDEQGSGARAVPTPAAGFAGLTLLGLLAARRRRQA